MTSDPAPARWLALVTIRIAGSAGAVFGLVLAARASAIAIEVLGIAIVLSALLMIAIVPRGLAARWRTPPE